MANDKNLRPLNTRTKSEQREIAKKGGVASGKARREKKAFKELIDTLLAEEGGNIGGKPATRKEMVAARAVRILTNPEAADTKEFLKAFEIVRDTIGEKPIEKVMVSEVEQDVIDEVERMVLGDDQETDD